MSATPHRPRHLAIRAPELSDLDAVVRICQAQELADDGELSTATERLSAQWQALGPQLATDAWVAVAADGNLAAYAQLARMGEVFAPRLWVTPEQRDAGLAMALLALAEERARAIGREAGATSLKFFAQGASENTAGAAGAGRHWLRRHLDLRADAAHDGRAARRARGDCRNRGSSLSLWPRRGCSVPRRRGGVSGRARQDAAQLRAVEPAAEPACGELRSRPLARRLGRGGGRGRGAGRAAWRSRLDPPCGRASSLAGTRTRRGADAACAGRALPARRSHCTAQRGTRRA